MILPKYSCLTEMISILEKLEKGIQGIFDLSSENILKANAVKCLINLIASSKVTIDIHISDIKVTSESRVKLLGIHIDNRLSFDDRVSQFYKKASKKLHALARIFKYLETSPVDTGRKLNVHKAFKRRPGRLLNVLSTFNLRPVSAGSKRRDLVNSFISSQFPYCPLIWMFHSRRMEHGINRINERAFRLIYPSDSN